MNKRSFISQLGMLSISYMLPTTKTEKKLLIHRILHDSTNGYENIPVDIDLNGRMGTLEIVIDNPQSILPPNTPLPKGVEELLSHFEGSPNMPTSYTKFSIRDIPDYIFSSIEDADKFLWKLILEGDIHGSEKLLKYENNTGLGIGTSFRIYCNSAAWRGRRGHANLLMGKELYEFSRQCMTMEKYKSPHPQGEFEHIGDSELFEGAIELNDAIPHKMVVGAYTGCEKWDGVGNYRILPDGKVEMVLVKNWKDHMLLLRYE